MENIRLWLQFALCRKQATCVLCVRFESAVTPRYFISVVHSFFLFCVTAGGAFTTSSAETKRFKIFQVQNHKECKLVDDVIPVIRYFLLSVRMWLSLAFH